MIAISLAVVTAAQIVPVPMVPAAHAADLSKFNPGRIIDDAMFYNGDALNARHVQDFLNTKVSSCRSGHTCLKDLRMDTTDKPADAMCAGYTGLRYESAADIIAKVGKSCGISQKALIVTLQKEQGLVTASAPSTWDYTIAMGQGCPDTAACDTAYYGFFNQVYGAARQFKRYTNPPGTSNYFNWYAPGKTWNIQFNPNAGCGSAPVYIQNKATSGLYYYTPYQPNRAALDAGYSTGDGCSSYGNRNFFNYFTDWFGATTGPDVGSYFLDYYQSNSAWLGRPTTSMTCDGPDGGCSQKFEGGIVTSSTHSYAMGVGKDYVPAWANYGREYTGLGYPTSAQICADMAEACRQEFQGGWIVSNANIGVRVVLNSERVAWSNWGREYRFLGLPVGDRACSDVMCSQVFEGGWITSTSSSGIQVVPNVIVRTWSNWGREFDVLGYPTGSPVPPDPTTGNYAQQFQGGTITVTNGTAVLTAATDPWVNALVSNTWLGSPTSNRSCTLGSGGCYQPFQGGWVVQKGTAAFAVPTVVRELWSNWGREYDVLGYPVSGPSANPTTGNYAQQFQGGTITVTNGTAVLTAATDPWVNALVSNTWLGSPTSNRSCTLGSGGCYQPFQGGWVVQKGTAAFAVPTVVRELWSNWGREYDVLGYPVSGPSANPTTGNYAQQFQGGTITVTNGTAVLTAATDPWVNALVSNTWLGSPTSNRSCTLGSGGCYQPFQGGWVVQKGTAAFAVPTVVRELWSNWGREYDVLGYPVSGPSANPTTGNYAQQFQGGTITVTNGTGGVAIP